MVMGLVGEHIAKGETGEKGQESFSTKEKLGIIGLIGLGYINEIKDKIKNLFIKKEDTK